MDKNTETFLQLRGIDLRFDGHHVLQNFDLDLHPQERLVILGRSGSGKSTLLRLLLGILKPNAGSIRFHDQELTRLHRSDLDRIRCRMGMVYQQSSLISSLNVRENLSLPLEELTNQPPTEITRRVEEKLGLVGMREARELMPDELSGGMKKRVSLARALVMEPELLLFDEPSTGLDPVTGSLIDDLIINLTQKVCSTSIIVTHDMASAFRVGTRLAMLHQGRIIEDGPPEAFRASQNPLVAQFISGNPKGPLTEEEHGATPAQ